MSTNLEYRERERQTRGRRQASEAQREKEQQRASARDKKQRRRISLEKQHENFVAVVRKWEMLPVSKVKMCFCSKKKKANRKTSIKIFCEHIRHFLHKTCNLLRKFHIATTTTARKCTKKSAARAKLFFFLQNIPYTKYPRKYFTQIYRDLYGDAMLVPTWMGTNVVDGNQQKYLLPSIGTKE